MIHGHWKKVASAEGMYTRAMYVGTGVLVCDEIYDPRSISNAMVFIPDVMLHQDFDRKGFFIIGPKEMRNESQRWD